MRNLRNPFGISVFILLLSSLHFLCSQEVLIDSKPLWRRALGGEINAFAAQGPGGDVYIVADDRALHSLNPENGESNWIFRPGGRLKSMLMVAPDGTIYVQNDRMELFAVTLGGTGRWKLRMGAEAAALPAAAPDGRIVLPLKGGRIVCVSRHGIILWAVDESAEASAAPLIDADGQAWVALSDGRILVLDNEGREIAHSSPGGAVSVLAMDSSFRIWAGGFNGRVSVFSEPEYGESTLLQPVFELKPSSSRIAAVLSSDEGIIYVFTADGDAVFYDDTGNELNRVRIAISGGAPSLSSDGVIFAPASDGSIRIIYPDSPPGELRESSFLAEPLLTDEGVLIAGGGDWILYAWKARLPGGGWSQFRGSSRRSGTLPLIPPAIDRKTARRDPAFYYRERMAVSDDLSEKMRLLNELEAYRNSREMHRELPWVDLLLEDLVSAGTSRGVNTEDLSLKSHPSARARAYLLIAGNEDFRSRDLILDCLKNEEDPVAMAAGFRALGIIGSDWDGASLRMISRAYGRISPAGENLSLETARALADLVRYNGDITDPSGYSLIIKLLESPLSASAREELVAIIRNVAGL